MRKLGGQTMRLFVAVNVAENVKKAAKKVQDVIARSKGKIKLAGAETMHFTLAFLGDTSVDSIRDIKAKIENTIEGSRPFSVAIQGAGAFPSFDRPRVVWLGVEDGSDELIELAMKLRKALSDYVTEDPEKPYKPHLTIARVNSGGFDLGELLADQKDRDYGECFFANVILYESVLGRGGPAYTPLANFPLRP
ncbi:MAG: RNA 2',3'-cyclic phosphodiesterase [Planctomycetes bacterium]|nr:RNA 2',3'-cyclic phosphodiesterase [Planctomycetota bacterium]